MAEQRAAFDVRAHVRKAIGGKAAVTAKAREKARVLTGVVRNERRSSGVELLLHASEGREQARFGGRQLGRPRDDEIRLAVAGRREIRIRVNRPRFRAPVAGRCAGSNRILLLKLGADQQVPAVVVAEGHAEAERGVHVLAVAFGRLAVIKLCLEPVELLVQDHVDDARNCIRAVRGRSTAGDDLHSLDEHRRDQRQIDCAAFGVRHDAPRVDER